MRDDRGQIITLAALAVCVCMIMVAMCLGSIREAQPAGQPWPGAETLENIVWAQDAGLQDAAGITGTYAWDSRGELEKDYRDRVAVLAADISNKMLAQGAAFTFEYNATLAALYAAGKNDTTLTGSNGLLFRKNVSTCRVCGCACDVSLTDGSSRYSLSRIVLWA
jgi:hypothetical protein